MVLDRLAVVPRPGPDAATVLAALLDGVDVVVVGDGAALVDADRRRLTARARERGTVLLSTSTWPGAHVVLAAEPVGWTGLGDGHGHLRRHRLAVTRSGRGSAGRAARAEVVLPLPAQASQPEATETHRGRRAGVSPGGSGVPGMPDMPDVPAESAVPLRMVG
ncbi:hypothetical protein [Cellulomonas sp. ATA003]|uniref:hypothetical protein n=1 Tax=Cellulomonas sp. ATA003 TaxID=3073064 RepID=UPI002873654D|nr:hypothetical protein [Cellulomonas sp. ATA003]WNB86829.1 hypothetical protein REH70_06480 [Cellulomonas sp. ATA003]